MINAQNLIQSMAQVLKQKLGDKLYIRAETWRKVGLEALNKPDKCIEHKQDREKKIGPSRYMA